MAKKGREGFCPHQNCYIWITKHRFLFILNFSLLNLVKFYCFLNNSSCAKLSLLLYFILLTTIYVTQQKKTLLKSSRPEVFLRKGFLKICSKFTREHPCRRTISIKLLCNFIEIALRHGCSPVNLLQNTFSNEHLWVAASVSGTYLQQWCKINN